LTTTIAPTSPLTSVQLPLRQRLLGVGVILILTFIAYTSAIHGDFIGDDTIYITGEPLVQAPDGIWRFWVSTEPVDYYPITFGLFWIEWRFWGDNPTGYHVVNLILHTVACALVWRVLRVLRVPGAYAAALLFAVHPINVQSVAWIASRKNILSLIFAAWATLLYLRSDDRLGGRGRWRYWLALVVMELGLLSKTAIFPLPAVLLLCEWWMRGGRMDRRVIVRAVPFFVVALAMTLFTIWFQYSRGAIGEDVRSESVLSRVGGAGWIIWFYLIKVLAPVNLMYGYPDWPVNVLRPALYFAPLAALVVVFVVLWRHSRTRTWARAALFAFAYFVLMLIPVSGLINTGFFRYSLVADHYVYYSSIAVIALVTAGATIVIRRLLSDRAQMPVAFGVSAVVVFFLLALAMRRSEVWRTEESLWRDAFVRNHSAWYAHNNYGLVMLREGRTDEAAQHFRRSIGLNAANDQAYLNLGRYHEVRGEHAEAVAVYRRGLERVPKSPSIFYNFGAALQAQGHLDEAAEAYTRALELKPRDAKSHNNLGAILLARGQTADASRHLEQSIAIDPTSSSARVNLANALIAEQRVDEARTQAIEALRLDPNNAKAHNTMGIVHVKQKRLEDAARSFRRAVELDPNFEQARRNLGAIERLPEMTIEKQK